MQHNSLALYLRDSKLPGFIYCNMLYPSQNRLHAFFPHAHPDRLELFYIVEGETFYCVGDDRFHVSAGDLIICNQNVVHGDANDNREIAQNLKTCCLGLNRVAFIGMPDNTLSYGECGPVLRADEESRDVGNLLKLIYSLSQGPEDSSIICQSLSTSVLFFVHQRLMRERRRTVTSEDKAPAGHDLCSSMRNFLDQNYREDLSLKQVGDQFNASEYHLAHLFKDYYSISPMKYLLKRRIGEAQMQLIDTEYPIALIAEKVNGVHPLTLARFSASMSAYLRSITGSNSKACTTHLASAEPPRKDTHSGGTDTGRARAPAASAE